MRIEPCDQAGDERLVASPSDSHGAQLQTGVEQVTVHGENCELLQSVVRVRIACETLPTCTHPLDVGGAQSNTFGCWKPQCCHLRVRRCTDSGVLEKLAPQRQVRSYVGLGYHQAARETTIRLGGVAVPVMLMRLSGGSSG